MTSPRPARLAFAAVTAAAVGVAFAACWLRAGTGGAPEVERFRDDAYYYFAWVRALAAGLGPTVSDGVPTSGVHPLWGLLLLPFAGSIESAARWLGVALHVATAALLGRAAGGRGVGFAVGACWLGGAALWTEAQNGQETALGGAALAALLLARDARWPAFAALAVAAVAARSDLYPFVAALACLRAEPASRRAAAALLPLLAYAGWNCALAGHPLQDSAAPIPWLVHDAFAATAPDAGERLARWWWFGRPVLLGGPFALHAPVAVALAAAAAAPEAAWLRGPLRLAPLLLVGAGAAIGAGDLLVPAVAAAAWAVLPASPVREARLARAVLAAAVALAFVHGPWRQYPRDYYYVPIAVAASFVVARRLAQLGCWPGCAAVAALVLGNAAQLATTAPRRPWQAEMAMAGRHVDRFVPVVGERIGVFNAGLVAFHRGRGVVNLDGVVDRRAFAALRERALGAHLDALGVRFVLDNPVQFAAAPPAAAPSPHACGPYFGADFDAERDLVELVRFAVPGDAGRPGTDSFRLYWRRGRGAMPAPPAACAVLGRTARGAIEVCWPSRGGALLAVRADGARVPLLAGADGVCLVTAVPVGLLPCVLEEDGRAAPRLTLER